MRLAAHRGAAAAAQEVQVRAGVGLLDVVDVEPLPAPARRGERRGHPLRGTAGGPLGLVHDGDWIVLDVPNRRLELDVPAEELARRTPSARMTAAFAAPARGWERLYVDHVLQADTGADLDFLVGSSGSAVSRESH